MIKLGVLILFSFCLIPCILAHWPSKNSIGQECTADNDCIRSLLCNKQAGVCRCQPDHIWSNKERKCLKCPKNWFEYGNACYYVSTEIRNWPSAKHDCEHRGGQLLVVESELIIDFSYQFFNATGIKGQYWVGARTIGVPKNWTWSDGVTIPSSGMWWIENSEPSNGNNQGLKIIEGCASLRSLGLNDTDCELNQKYICEAKSHNKYHRKHYDYKSRYNLYGLRRDFDGDNLYRGDFPAELVNLNQKCRFEYQCASGLKCVDGKCKCPANTTYADSLNACIRTDGSAVLLNGKSLLIVNGNFSWFNASLNALASNASMFYTDVIGLLKVLNYLMINRLRGPYWIGATVIKGQNVWNDNSTLVLGPWVKDWVSNERGILLDIEFGECWAIEDFELTKYPCSQLFSYIAIFEKGAYVPFTTPKPAK